MIFTFGHMLFAFGCAVLSAFKVVMDRNNWRVGLQEKSPEPNNDSACAARAVCMSVKISEPRRLCGRFHRIRKDRFPLSAAVSQTCCHSVGFSGERVCADALFSFVCSGEQVYVPYTNRCADPDCSIKILFEMNQETK